MYGLKHAAYVDLFRLEQFKRLLITYGYPEQNVFNTIRLLMGSRNHPLLYDVNNPDWLFHLTTCSHAAPTQLIGHYAQLIKISDTLISGVDRAQCTFDFRGRWPRTLFSFEEYAPTTKIGQRGSQWLIDHQDILFAIDERVALIDFNRFTPLLDTFTSYPLLP